MITIDYLRRQEALDILSQVQQASVRNGTDILDMEDIDAEITSYRQEKFDAIKCGCNENDAS